MNASDGFTFAGQGDDFGPSNLQGRMAPERDAQEGTAAHPGYRTPLQSHTDLNAEIEAGLADLPQELQVDVRRPDRGATSTSSSFSESLDKKLRVSVEHMETHMALLAAGSHQSSSCAEARPREPGPAHQDFCQSFPSRLQTYHGGSRIFLLLVKATNC